MAHRDQQQCAGLSFGSIESKFVDSIRTWHGLQCFAALFSRFLPAAEFRLVMLSSGSFSLKLGEGLRKKKQNKTHD